MREITFHFVRHGETDHNRRGIVQGRGVDAVLNATGQAQAAALARRFAGVGLDAIYASTLRRAGATAEAVARHHEAVPLRRLADLEEMAWGVYEGRPFSPQVLEDFDVIQYQWRGGNFGLRIDGGESILDVQARGLRVVDALLDRHLDETLLVVTHGRFLRVLLSSLLDDYGLERMHEIEHANTGVNTLVWRDGRFHAERLNCTAHLDDDALHEAA